MNRTPTNQASLQRSPEIDQTAGPREEGVKINGMQQVIELLQHADPAFRESLLRRLTQKDPKLAQQLRRIIR